MDGDYRPYMGTADVGADEFVGTHSLSADGFEISEVPGGEIEFDLYAGSENGGRTYVMLGSVTGTAPGNALPGNLVILPLNGDGFTNFIIKYINSPSFVTFMGTLDQSGNGWAKFDTKGPIPGLAGVTFSFAYAIMKPWDFVSNPINIEVQ